MGCNVKKNYKITENNHHFEKNDYTSNSKYKSQELVHAIFIVNNDMV